VVGERAYRPAVNDVDAVDADVVPAFSMTSAAALALSALRSAGRMCLPTQTHGGRCVGNLAGSITATMYPCMALVLA
jgi:hypothetical protein